MGSRNDLHLQLVRQAADRRRESDQHFRAVVFAARAVNLPLSQIAEAAGLSVARIHAIVEEAHVQTFASAHTETPMAAPADVLVVAAAIAYEEYLHYNAYVCQKGRSFRDVDRMGFYRRGKIERHFPTIRANEDHVPFTREHASQRRTTGSPVDDEIANLIDTLLDHHRRENGIVEQVFLLSPPDDPRTLTLAQPIRHETVGRGSAWTMGQRYITEDALRRNPQTTGEL